MEARITNKFELKCTEKITEHFAMPFIFTAACLKGVLNLNFRPLILN